MFSYLEYSRDTVVYIRVWKTFPRLLYLDERCGDESWRKVEIFNVTTIPVRSTVSVRYRYESMTVHDGNATVNDD